MPKITVAAEMGEGDLPEAVRLEVKQGPHTLRTADVDAHDPKATFDVDEGDYVATAQSLVPHGTPVEASFAVPVRVTIE